MQTADRVVPSPLSEEGIQHIKNLMESIGVPEKLHECTLGAVSKAFRSQVMQEKCAGFWVSSWGIIGKPGVGKSAILAACIRRQIVEDLNGPDEGAYLPPVMWVDWPARTDLIRRKLSAGDFSDAQTNLDDIKAFLEEVDNPVLVLDDLGRERTGQTKSWAVEKLELLLDSVWNNRAVVLHWTSNYGFDELSAAYTPALVSRLFGKAHEIKCPANMPDRRLHEDSR